MKTMGRAGIVVTTLVSLLLVTECPGEPLQETGDGRDEVGQTVHTGGKVVGKDASFAALMKDAERIAAAMPSNTSHLSTAQRTELVHALRTVRAALVHKPANRKALALTTRITAMLDACKRLTLTVTVGNSVTVFPKTVIVLPFRNQAAKAAQARAGQAISEELAGLLAATGTYDKVYNRNDLRDLVDPEDLPAVTGGEPAAIAAALRKRGIVEAMITGVVTSYESSSKRDVRESRKLVGFDPTTKLPLFKTVPTPFTTNEGTVSVAASLIRVRNAKPIHAADPIPGRYRSEGGADCMVCLESAWPSLTLLPRHPTCTMAGENRRKCRTPSSELHALPFTSD